VRLYNTEADARAALKRLDEAGCGGGCRRRHEVMDLRATAGVGLEGADATPRASSGGRHR
jgi:hypothetical protein